MSSSSKILERDDVNNVLYRICEPTDVNGAIAVIAEAFSKGEPIAGATGATFKDFEKLCGLYIPRMAEEGYMILAIDTKTGQILGGFANEDYCNPHPEELGDFLKNCEGDFGPTFTIFGALAADFDKKHGIAEEHAEREKGIFFHLWMLGVLPEASNRKIGTKLTEHSLKLAKEKGFECAFVECTNKYSTAIFKNVGAQEEKFIAYETFTMPDEDETQAAKKHEKLRKLSEQGHKGVTKMSKKLV